MPEDTAVEGARAHEAAVLRTLLTPEPSCSRPITGVLSAALVLSLAIPAYAEEEGKSGLSANKLSLPSGPGSLEGIGENAEPNVNMGLLAYGVPIQVPPGYGGLSPSLRLAYSSGSGDSVVGIGWSLGVPRIERMTSRGLPEYDASDLFAAGGGDELVRVGTTPTFRARYEGGFVRYTWTDPSGDGRGGYWIAAYPDGKTGYFGATQDGELEPAARVEDAAVGTFSYNLAEMVDVFGHRVRYHYEKNQGQSYLARAEWVFGDSATPRYAVELDYEPRDDELSDGKPGFLVTTAQRLSGIRVLVREELLRRYALTYEDLQASGGLSRLARVATYGSDDTTEYPVVFGFSYTGSFDPTCTSQSRCNLPYLTTVGSVGVSFKTGLADLTDINGDSLPDVVDTRDGVHVFHVANLTAAGGHTFQQPRQSDVADGGSVVLSSAQVQAADLDGNGFSDLVDAANRAVLWNHGTGDWHEQALVETHLPDFSQDADLRFFDYNHDRAIDVMHNDGDNTWYYLNQGDGTFASQAVDGEATGWGFAGHGAQLADLNGDGMQDLALPLSGQVSYRVNLGYGRFGPIQDMLGLDASLSPADMHLVDLNGDSLADVVVVLGSEVRFALNENGRSFSSMQTLSEVDGGSIPEVDATVSIRFADMNGSGSTDIVWINQSGEVTYLELYPRRPNLLSKIENGIGKVIEASYGSAALHMARDGGPEAWAYRLPQPVLTLDRLETYDTLSGVRQVQTLAYHNGFYDGTEKQFRGFRDVDVRIAGDASMEDGESRYVFEVGQYDPYRKGLLLERSQQSGGRLLSVARTSYDDCEVGGISQATALPVRSICKIEEEQVILEGLSEAEGVTTRSAFEYDAFGNVVRVAKLGVTSIGGGGCEPCEYDPSEVHGAACGPACLGDESYEETAYVPLGSTGGRWLLGAPYRKRMYGTASGPSTEKLTYYDGEPFVGLGLGELTDGLATRVTQRVSQDSGDVVTTGTAYDGHGNPIEVRDANGHSRRFSYDAEDSLLLLGEGAVFDDAGHDPYELRMEVDRHPLYETVSASHDWVRIESGALVSEPRAALYDYDTFGRLIALARPGDDLTTPTQEFSYELSDPLSRIVTRTRSVADSEPDLEQVQCFDGLGRKLQERTRIEGDEYQVSGFVELNVQGKEQTVYQPYVETGSACSESAPGGVLAVRTTFDATGRVLSVTHPDADTYGTASIEKMLYEPMATVSFDAEDSDPGSEHYATPTRAISDGLGRPVAVERLLSRRGDPVETGVFYDTLGRMSRVVDDAGNTRSYTYDLLGRMLSIDDPDAGHTSFAHDAAGNVTRQTDARGKTTRTTYDEANRPVAVWDADDEGGTLVDYAYDGLDGCGPSVCSHPEGRLVRISFPVEDGVRSASRGVDLFGYDTRGRPSLSLRQLWGVAFESSAQFDNADRLVAAQYPNGTTIESLLDGLGRTVSVPGYVDSVTYTARNQQDEVLLHNGVQTTREYDARMRLVGLESLGPSSSPIQGYTYEHDRVGNLQRVQDSRQAGPTADASYSYDSLYRLTEASLDVGRAAAETLSYAYNRIDNIESKTSSLGASSAAHVGPYQYGERGAGPHAVTSAGGRSYSYDAAGNVAQRGLDSYAWDYQGRLASASRGPQHRAQFVYGAGRERVLKREGAHTSLYVSPDFEIRDGVSTLYVRLSGERVAKVESLDFDAQLLSDLAPEGSPDGQITGGDAYVSAQEGARAELVRVMQAVAAKRALLSEGPLVTYLYQNHLGTTAVTTDAQGEILQRAEHYPYGEARYQSKVLEDYSWTGQERDQRTGLSYHSARYFDTWSGRWTAPDPLFLASPEKSLESPGEMTLHSYARNSPLVFTDPTGLAIFNITIKGGGPNVFGHTVILHVDEETKAPTFYEVTGPDSKHVHVYKRDLAGFKEHYGERVPDVRTASFDPTQSVSGYDVVKVQGINEDRVRTYLDVSHERFSPESKNLYPYEFDSYNCATFAYETYSYGGKAFTPDPSDRGENPRIYPRDLSQAIRFHNEASSRDRDDETNLGGEETAVPY